MDLSQIFGVFSRRRKGSKKAVGLLTPEFRYRIFILCEETFHVDKDYSHASLHEMFWLEIYKKLRFLHGYNIGADERPISPYEDSFTFLSNCSDEHFLDFVEFIFQTTLLWQSRGRTAAAELVDDVNLAFEADDLPFFLTGFVTPAPPKNVGRGSGRALRGMKPTRTAHLPKIVAYPQIISKEDRVLHQQAIEPTLSLLTEPHLALANEEFLDALKDYRKGDYRDCVVKCGSSFESVMKIICDRKKWPYNQTDTAGPLLKTILPRTTLASFFEQPIMLIATIRNRYSTAHGAGTRQKTVSKHVANYVVNATATAILLLVDETNP